MKRLLLACLAVAVTAPSAAAAPGTCLSLTDPEGDTSPTVLTSKEAVDLVAGHVVTSPRGVTVTFTLAGPPEPSMLDHMVYRAELVDYPVGAVREYRLEAIVSPGEEPVFRVTEVSHDVETQEVITLVEWDIGGAVDLARHTVTMTSPARPFGGIREGRRWEVDAIRVMHGHHRGSYYGGDSIRTESMPVVAGDGRCRTRR